MGFPCGSAVKNPPAMQESQETQVWSLDREDPLEKGMATHSSILAWSISRTEEPNVLHDWVTNTQPSWPTWSRSLWRLWKSGLTLFKVSLIAKVFAGLESWQSQLVAPWSGQRMLYRAKRKQQGGLSGPCGPNHRRCLYQCTAEPQLLDSALENLPRKSLPSFCSQALFIITRESRRG